MERPLAIRAEDLKRSFVFDVAKGVSERNAMDRPVHISAHSQSLFDWLGRPFGASIFWVGADLTVEDSDLRPVRSTMLAGLLLENGLALRDVWTLLNRRLFAGDARMEGTAAASPAKPA